MKNNKNIRKLKFDISVRPAKEAVPESGNTMYHEDQLYHAHRNDIRFYYKFCYNLGKRYLISNYKVITEKWLLAKRLILL